MSITHKEVLHCPCGRDHSVVVVKSLNATRHPHLREQVLARQLHRFACESCKRWLVIDTELFWFDFHRKQFIGVFPTALRGQPEQCEPILAATFQRTMKDQAPRMIQAYADGFLVRTCFGLEELREKIVAHEAGLDDFLLEVLKVELLTAHPELLERGVVTVRLDSFLDDGSLRLLPEAHDGALVGDPPVAIGARRAVYDALVPHRDALRRERGAIVSGSHVSLRRVVDAM